MHFLLQLNIIGKHNYIKVLNYCADIISAESYRHGSSAEPHFKKCLAEINGLLSKF